MVEAKPHSDILRVEGGIEVLCAIGHRASGRSERDHCPEGRGEVVAGNFLGIVVVLLLLFIIVWHCLASFCQCSLNQCYKGNPPCHALYFLGTVAHLFTVYKLFL